MCANAWGNIKYSRVHSVCMNKHKRQFEKHDQERFEQYLADVAAGKKTIASGALKPHELVQQAMKAGWYVEGCCMCCLTVALEHEYVHVSWQSLLDTQCHTVCVSACTD